jgi:predicted secreted hydrolase
MSAPPPLRRLVVFAGAALVLGAAVVVVLGRGTGPPAGVLSARQAVSVRDVLGGEGGAFARAEGPRAFHFPEDHGPHPEYRSEWWYFTGNLAGVGGRRFGFHLTLFRFALAPEPPEGRSAWAASQVFMGHLALTDVAGRSFSAHERLARGALGLAGAGAAPVRVWVEDWRVEAGPDGEGFRLRAREGGVGLDLTVRPEKPVVLQGDAGLSQKSAEAGNASYYYSYTRMAASGTLTGPDGEHRVQGLAWMDREWSTSALGPEQVGWDWFALQLDDGQDLMFYQLRRRDGSVDPHSKGSLVAREGAVRPLEAQALRVEVLDHWESPLDGTRYPSRWRLAVPDEGIDLEVSPLLADQELHLSVRYWEGAVRVTGTRRGSPVTGYGYVELTGYAGG